MTTTQLLADLQRVAPNARVLTGGGVDGYDVDGVPPSAVVQLRDADEVAAVLRLAGSQGLTVVPRGGGTAIEQGNPPKRMDLVLDLTRMDRLIEHRPQDLTVTVEAGLTVGALQRELAAHGQMLALDPPLAARATVGGVLAANSWGPRRHRYGTARDLLIGSRAVLADGTRLHSGGKVVKNVAGYDLNKMLVGSAGTLAVIVEATLKVAPVPGGLGMLVAAFPDFGAAHAVALAVSGGKLQPLTLDLIGPPAARRLTSASRAEPAEDAWLLAAELGGSPGAVERTTRELVHMATAAGSSEVTALERGQRESLLNGLRDYGRTVENPATMILRASVLPSDLPAAVRAFEQAARGARPAVIVRAGSGVAYSYWGGESATQGDTIVREVRAALAPIGGSIVIERAPLSVKATTDVWGIEGADVDLMRRLKDAYDPSGVLSPARLI